MAQYIENFQTDLIGSAIRNKFIHRSPLADLIFKGVHKFFAAFHTIDADEKGFSADKKLCHVSAAPHSCGVTWERIRRHSLIASFDIKRGEGRLVRVSYSGAKLWAVSGVLCGVRICLGDCFRRKMKKVFAKMIIVLDRCDDSLMDFVRNGDIWQHVGVAIDGHSNHDIRRVDSTVFVASVTINGRISYMVDAVIDKILPSRSGRDFSIQTLRIPWIVTCHGDMWKGVPFFIGIWANFHVRQSIFNIQRNHMWIWCNDALETINFNGLIKYPILKVFKLSRRVDGTSCFDISILVENGNDLMFTLGSVDDPTTCDNWEVGKLVIINACDVHFTWFINGNYTHVRTA